MKALGKIALALALLNPMAVSAAKISELEFADTRLSDVIRTLSELSQSNIIATPSAIDKRITIHLKNVSDIDAIKSISRISDLWYRYDQDTNTYRIMTREEYAKDLVVRESQRIEVFRLLNANVRIVAQAIEDLYGERVELSLGEEPGQTGSSSRNSRSSSNSNSNSSNRNSNSSLQESAATEAAKKLSLGQLEQLLQGRTNSLSIDPAAMQAVTLKAQPIYVTVNNEHNMIIVRTDDSKIINSIKQLVDKMDIPVPQVMLEMKILSITLGDDFNSIFNFELVPQGGNQSTVPIKLGNNALLNSGSFIYEFLNDKLKANIEFLDENKRLKVLSNPMVLASNHREADLFIGEESVLTRGFTFNPAQIDNGVVVSPSYIETDTELEEIGISLKITPRINSDGTVLLELQQESSTLNPGGGTIPVPDGNGNVVNLAIDTVNTSRLKGIVAAKNGLTVAVGGLIRTTRTRNERKVPLLGEVPVVGNIFKSTIESDEETEMVLLITPRILNSPSQSQELQQSNNRFYQQYNEGFPDPAPAENRFIKEPLPQPSNQQLQAVPKKAEPTLSDIDQFMMDAG